jgi:uroporphyrin-III C-methyltransferase
VALVGCGPGEPDLLTLRAVSRIERADVLLYDRLTDPAILDRAPDASERVYCGKRCGRHSMSQAQINELLIERARLGQRVVRLKGGDPFIFGRGGEELEACLGASIPCEVVPGVTAAIGCAATTGIPLTHRGVARAVTFVTGHCRDGNLPGVDWQGLVNDQQTLVFYMGLKHFDELRQRLLDNGVPGSRPVAVIHNGTRNDQEVHRDRLDRVASEGAGNERPAVIIVGGCVEALPVADALLAAQPGGIPVDQAVSV